MISRTPSFTGTKLGLRRFRARPRASATTMTGKGEKEGGRERGREGGRGGLIKGDAPPFES